MSLDYSRDKKGHCLMACCAKSFRKFWGTVREFLLRNVLELFLIGQLCNELIEFRTRICVTTLAIGLPVQVKLCPYTNDLRAALEAKDLGITCSE